MTYPRLDHGLIGNGRLLALVSPTTAIEWLCMPRFDSPSVFGRLLDAEKGGTFRVLLDGKEAPGVQRYMSNTNVLITHLSGESGEVEVIDFAPRIAAGLGVRAPLEIMRLVRPLSGAPRVTFDVDPRPSYARETCKVAHVPGGLRYDAPSDRFHLQTNVPATYLERRAPFALRQPAYFVFSNVTPTTAADEHTVTRALSETKDAWRAWAKTCALPTFAAEWVLRSALCLKLHTYEDTGAIIAASTTSIPEAFNTERTWDYRYCWLRDAAFVVEALRRLGHLNEGERFISFLRDVVEAGPLQPLYGIGGERDLTEEMLPHLAGFGGNGHVRIGNAAALQQQNDLNGEIILCLETMLTDPRLVIDDVKSFEALVERLVEDAIDRAPKPDTGIWEFRTLPRPYTFSRAMCWAAMDRGAKLARALMRPDLADRWARIAERERDLVLREAFSEKRGYFTQALNGDFADASNLLLPTIGLVDARDPRFQATLDAYSTQLARNGFMLRYSNTDDFGETTSAFTLCSFWWAEALALAGRLDQAIEVFERLLKHSNSLRLFSEDIDPVTGALLGNYPQAYTHVGLIHAAMTISELLEVRDGRVRAWT